MAGRSAARSAAFGVKGPRAAEAAQATRARGARRSPTAGRRCATSDRDDSWNVVGRLGSTEFFIEERGEAAGIAALEQLTREAMSPAPIRCCAKTSRLVLGGARAADVLAQVCNVNFAALDIAQRAGGHDADDRRRRAGDAAATPMTAPIYRIWCDPSFGSYLWETLEEVVQKMPGRNQ